MFFVSCLEMLRVLVSCLEMLRVLVSCLEMSVLVSCLEMCRQDNAEEISHSGINKAKGI